MGKLKLVILLLLGLFAMRTFLGPDFYDGHDSQAHIVRLWQFDKDIKAGQIPPRWAPDLYAGRGYPVFIFAYPLPYFVAEGFHLFGFDQIFCNLAIYFRPHAACSPRGEFDQIIRLVQCLSLTVNPPIA